MAVIKTETVTLDNFREADRFIGECRFGHFLQTSFWGRVKSDWKWFGIICRDDNGLILGTMAVLLRQISHTPFHLMYSPRGPVCDPGDEAVFTALIDAAVKEGKKYNAYALRLDKDVNTDNEEYRRILAKNGFTVSPVTDGFNAFQCQRVIRIDLEGKTEDEVFASFDSGHRRKIRVALKNNVEIEKCGSEKAELFYDMMKETTERDGFSLRSADYFGKIVDEFGDKAAIYIAYYTPEGGERQAIAGALSVEYGDRFWYFYGASRNSHRQVMPNYLVQWSMIKDAIAHGCKTYDFRGVAKFDENDGLYRFKSKFGSYSEEFVGEANLILKPVAAKLISALQR